MTVNEIISLAQTFAGVTSSQVSDADTLKFVNLSYHNLEEIIRNSIAEDYFYDYFNTDTKLNQSEYNFALIEPTSTVPGILKIVGVGVLYGSEYTEYANVRAFGTGSLTQSPEYYSASQSQADPFYIYKDNSIFIYPAPDNDGNTALVDGDTVITDGIRVHCSVSLIDLVSGGAETTVEIPRNHHEAIALKAATYIYMHRSLGGSAIAIDTDRRAMEALNRMKENMTDRSLQPIDQDLPSLTYLKY